MDPDRPRSLASEDRLGFGEVAAKLAETLAGIDMRSGFVIAIEGPWGSGKSSLVKMALKQLEEHKVGPAPVSFSPWLIGNRDDLLAELFKQLGETADKESSGRKAENTKQLFRKFALMARGAGSMASLAALVGLPGAPIAEGVAKLAGDTADSLSQTSLEEMKDQIAERLRSLKRPLLVFIDDLDRLDPTEAVEVLRLVRAVADFPNVGYLLAYDVAVLSRNLETALGIENGRSYLDKIVQVSFQVPEPLGFDLRSWLAREARTLFPDFSQNEAAENRFRRAMDDFGRVHISTPRDVVRILNALKLHVTPVRDRIDPGDMVFLQIIRLKDPGLYEWVVEYVHNIVAVGDWGQMMDEDIVSSGLRLRELTENPRDKANLMLEALADILPGIHTSWFGEAFSSAPDREEYPKVYGEITDKQREALAKERRLASREHYRFYFAFSEAPGRVTEAEFVAFIRLAVIDAAEASKLFLDISRRERPQGGTLAPILLDKLIHADMTSDEASGVLRICGGTLDTIGRDFEERSQVPDYYLGDRGANPFRILAKVAPDKRHELLAFLFEQAPAIGWLLRSARDSKFEHDPPSGGLRSRAPLLSAEEHAFVKVTLLHRLAGLDTDAIDAVPHLRGFLLSWILLGDPEATRRCAATLSHTDEGFLKLLWRLRSHHTVNGQSRLPLLDTTLDRFLDGVDAVNARLTEIADRPASDPALAQEARALLALIEPDPFAET